MSYCFCEKRDWCLANTSFFGGRGVRAMFLGKSGMSGCGSATPVARISTTCAIMSARYGYNFFSLMGLATQSLLGIRDAVSGVAC